VAIIALLVGLLAYLTPPNNPDSLFYHMARVLHWSQNQTVAHYPTNSLFQLFYPPWAEFAIMHFYILSGGDHWSNMIQWVSMLGSVIGSVLVAKQLGADIDGQVLAAVVVVTIPMGMLQGASTQNDYVTTFWLVVLVYYALRFQTQAGWMPVLAVSGSAALALLTKVTAYIYAFPILLWFVFALTVHFRSKVWQPALLIGLIILTLNSGHYARNFELWGNPLGIDQENSHPNRHFSVAVTVSNVIRNISVHLGTRSSGINRTIYETIGSLHRVLEIDVHDPRTTMIGRFEQNWLSNSENRAGNPVHIILIISTLGLLVMSRQLRNSQTHALYAIVLVAAFLVFCSFVKWEIWHSRLHLPLFVLWSPLVSAVLIRQGNYRLVTLFAVIMLIASTLYVSRYAIPLILGAFILWLFSHWQKGFTANRVLVVLTSCFLLSASTWYIFDNHSRPLLGRGERKSIFSADRTDQLFLYYSYRSLRDTYQNAAQFIISRDCRNVGLASGPFGRQYLFWVLLQAVRGGSVRMEHFNVTNLSRIKSRVEPFSGFTPCAVIVANTDSFTDMPTNINGRQYVKAWSSGPVRLNGGFENVSVLLPKSSS
jgi:hypothetical protein